MMAVLNTCHWSRVEASGEANYVAFGSDSAAKFSKCSRAMTCTLRYSLLR